MEHYELLQQIGKGTYGKVYTARNYVDHELYVLKRVPFEAASRADAEAAQREANLLSLLRHPHIVPYKEFFPYDGDLCLVMAHCEGGDLFQHIKQLRKSGKMVEEERVWPWLVQLLLALSYCHSKKILHRDVKTQNVFLTRDGRLMLGDFGLAKQLQRTLEMARTPIGTPYYMAPEIYEEAPYSFKSDVWALGCVMYELLTGRPAFAADNLSRVVIRVLKGTYDPLPSIYSEELRDVVGSMLVKDVSKRPTVNELLQHPFVLSKVQAYLDQLSTGGAKASWNTWRMKLPPSILAQMADIISKAGGSELPIGNGNGAAAPRDPVAPAAGGAGQHRGVSPRLEDLMSSTELIEEFGLQSLLQAPCSVKDSAASPTDQQKQSLQLLAATLHPEDRKHLAFPKAAGAISELQVLKSQLIAVRTTSSSALVLGGSGNRQEGEQGDSRACEGADTGPAAQLLGTTQRNATNRAAGGGGGGRGFLEEDAGPGPDFALLSAGLPKAGFGFGTRLPDHAAADVDTPRLKSAAKGALIPTSSLRRGQGKASQLGVLQHTTDPVLPDEGSDDDEQGYMNEGGQEAAWRLGTSMRNICLHDTLTNRAAFLRKELEAVLGRERLAAACHVVRELHDAAADRDDDVGLGALRDALRDVGVPAEHFELAPLLDELVLLQDRDFAD